jgi:Sigma-70 region 2
MCPTGLTERFEESSPRLRAVAYRMLGSVDDAEDAVQEAWLRLNRNTGDVDNLDAWPTAVVGRICLNMLRARRVRRDYSSNGSRTRSSTHQGISIRNIRPCLPIRSAWRCLCHRAGDRTVKPDRGGGCPRTWMPAVGSSLGPLVSCLFAAVMTRSHRWCCR